MSEDSYILWDGEDVPETERCIYIICVECREKGVLKEKKGQLWKAERGYGASITCGCGKIIHEIKD